MRKAETGTETLRHKQFESAEWESAHQMNALHSRINNQRDTIQSQSAELARLRARCDAAEKNAKTLSANLDYQATDQQVGEWIDRHDLGGNLSPSEARDAIDDARSLWLDAIARAKPSKRRGMTAERAKEGEPRK